MKYIIITAKHHEGFAMFRSKVTPFNVVDATPFGRDVPGRGGWIFRRGGDWPELDDYLGAFELTPDELDAWLKSNSLPKTLDGTRAFLTRLTAGEEL